MLLVDGHNLTFRDDKARRELLGGDPEGSRRRVIACVRLYMRSAHDRALIVFDGEGGGRTPPDAGPVRYCFAGAEHEADEEILRRIRAYTGNRELRLVTDDRALAAAARRLGARTVSLKAFLAETDRLRRRSRESSAPEPAAKYQGPPPSEVDYWLSVFKEADIAEIEKEPAPRVRRKRDRQGRRGR